MALCESQGRREALYFWIKRSGMKARRTGSESLILFTLVQIQIPAFTSQLQTQLHIHLGTAFTITGQAGKADQPEHIVLTTQLDCYRPHISCSFDCFV